MMAEKVMARGALQLPYISGPVPVKSKTALPCKDSKDTLKHIYLCSGSFEGVREARNTVRSIVYQVVN